MELSTNTRVVMGYETSCTDRHTPQYPHVKESDIEDISEKLKEININVDYEKSIKKLFNSIVNVTANFNEKVENASVAELCFVADNIEITVKNYHKSNKTKSIGAPISHSSGIEAFLTYDGNDQKKGTSLLEQAKEIIRDFYQKQCNYFSELDL